MQNIIFFLAGCVVLVNCGDSPIYRQIVTPLAEACQACVGASAEDVRRVVVQDKALRTVTQKCLQYCVYKKMNVIDGPTLAPVNVLRAAYQKVHEGDEDKLRRANVHVAKCMQVGIRVKRETSDACSVAAAVQECFRLDP